MIDEYDRRLRKIQDDVKNEQREQMRKWGIQDHKPLKWVAILTEEVGGFAEAALEQETAHERNLYRFWGRATRGELVQVAATAVSALEAIDRNSDRWEQAWIDERDRA